jgi:hypothetical protein
VRNAVRAPATDCLLAADRRLMVKLFWRSQSKPMSVHCRPYDYATFNEIKKQQSQQKMAVKIRAIGRLSVLERSARNRFNN